MLKYYYNRINRNKISLHRRPKLTSIYFVRHAEPDYSNHDDLTRSLTVKGRADTKLVNNYLEDKHIDIVISSPFYRAVQTVEEFAGMIGCGVTVIDDFRERRIDSSWIEDFDGFVRNQWNDFEYKLSDGENLREVQVRNINALNQILLEHKNKNIVVGGHGTAISTIIHYYDKSFGYDDFNRIKKLMPWIVKLSFEGERCVGIEQINLFEVV